MRPASPPVPLARTFGLVVVGDEVLNGPRRDAHLTYFRRLLSGHGHQLAWHWLLPDDPVVLTDHLRFSMSRPDPVFVCGGIGATPDDPTRACAAEAAGVPLERHPRAARLIEGRFGQQAYPNRILMADLPAGCKLIANPVNRVPGFALRGHWFLPGFPQMAWPMAARVLARRFEDAPQVLRELAVVVRGVPESSLVPLMRRLSSGLGAVKLFSLPHLGEDPHVLVGVRGRGGAVEAAFHRLCRELASEGVAFSVSAPTLTQHGAGA
jgi:molybdopterin-biosynthesis enzyme MoeA-like protein